MKYEAMEQIPIYCMQQKPGWMQNDFFVMRKKNTINVIFMGASVTLI